MKNLKGLCLATITVCISLSAHAQSPLIWDAGSSTNFLWSDALNWSGDILPGASDDVLFPLLVPNPGTLANPSTITLAAGELANSLTFLSSYNFLGGSLTLTSGAIEITLGDSVVMGTKLSGSAGLTLTGGGTLRLANTANDYTGTTTINDGTIIITGASALGTDSSAIVVNGYNPVLTSTNLRGFGGGSLFLDGRAGGFTISRDLLLQGQGPVADRGAALVSSGNNTLSGVVTMAAPYAGTNLSTRIISADGTLNLTGTLNVLGTAATTISNLGGVNQAGASFYNLTGVLTGTGTLESSGGGTLYLNPSDSSGFSGTIRVSGSAASGQSVVRIDAPGVLGTRTATGTGGVLDMNGGVLAVLMDTPSVLAGGTAASVYGRASSTLFADHASGSTVKDQTVTFGNLTYEDGITLTFNSRNGYGMSFTTAPVNGGNGDTTFTNSLQGGSLLTFTGNFWSNSDNTGNRTMTFGGNGNTTINGSIIASAASYNHNLAKSGSGTLTITGTASTLDGNVSVTGGTLAISDWRAITNNTSTVSLNGGILSVTGNNVSLANLTTSKVINLSGTTGGATILANQTGTSGGLVFNAAFTATGGGVKTLTLGGANTQDNIINGAIVNNSATNTTALTKIDAGTWVLAGVNTYSGATTISNGTLKLKANAASSTIINDSQAVIFNATNVYAGGTLEFVGQAGTANVETLGALTPTQGANTIKLTPGTGGSASLVFASLGTVGGGGTVNIDTPSSSNTVSFTTTAITNNIANAGLFYKGSNFAFVPGAASALRAPDYTTDADFATSSTALTASKSMEITGAGFNNGAITIDSLRINGGTALNMTGLLTIRTAGTANASGGIIQTGGSGTISGTGVTTGGSGALVINVDGAGNSLSLNAPITSTTTGGFTKVGEGTLLLGGANAETGTISINQGTVRLAGADRLGAGTAALTIRQDGILELNGVTPATATAAFNNNGIVRNSSATTDAIFTVGASNGTGTSYGIMEDGGVGKLSIVKQGTGAQSWLGLSTYTGSTTIGSTGIVTVNDLLNGGSASGIGASTNAASNLIFTGTSATQAYGGLSYTGTADESTDRLFTFNGGATGGARIQANGVNNATINWTNTGALAFGAAAASNAQGLVLGGASTGDNLFYPVISDNGAAVTSVYKADAGVWHLKGANTYTGATTLTAGTLYAVDGSSLPTASNLVFSGGNFASTGTFTRSIGVGAGQMQWGSTASGGFSAGDSKLTVDWGSGNVWGSTPGFLGGGALLLNNSGVAKSDVEITSGFEIAQGIATSFNATTTASNATVNLTSGTTAGLAVGQTISGNPNIPAGATIASIVSSTQFTLSSGTGVLAATGISTSTVAGGYRQVNVGDFTSIGADFATLSGVISGAGSLSKEGAGILNLLGANTYTGQTLVRSGTLVVQSLGNSATPGASSVGDSTLGNTDAGALTLGNGGTTAGILEYVGTGETSDRKIRLNTTTGSTQIHADGTGALILTNVANDMTAGAKLLYLRGVNAMGNMITSQLSDNVGTLGVVVDGSALWILTNAANNYSGTTTVSAGMLGIGANTALGTGNLDLSNGTVFAYGGDRTLANAVRLLNNTVTAVNGDYDLTFSTPLQLLAGANNVGLNNNIATGASLTFTGATADALTANRTWTIDGSGETIIDGNFTSSTAFGVSIAKTGDGTLQLNGTTSNFNQGGALLDIDRGTLRIGANEVIPEGVGFGSVSLSPELANGDTATLDLNGHTETINGLTATTDGTAIIDNTAATAATLVFGANDSAVTFGGGTGTYTIQNSGGGPLSLTKTGTGTATIPTGVTLTYTGGTNVNGGTFNIASAVDGTNALSATGGGTLALTGGITDPGAITSIEVGAGSTLSLLDGAGSQIANLTSLSLGNTGTGTATLNVNIGDLSSTGDGLNTDKLTLLTGGTLSLGNTITFNMTDAGLNANTTYTLLSIPDGGLGAFGLANIIQGATPGGFSGFTWDVQDTYVRITTGTLITGVSYWRGLTDTTWNANANNWSQDKAGTTPALSIPGQGTDVIFQWDAASNAAVTTTLEQNFKINSLTFEASSTPANTPTAITINPGAVSTNRLEIAPGTATDGIEISTGGPASVTIATAVKLGANQTWTVADATSALSLGSLLGEADVHKAGAGKVTLTAAADSTFNSGHTSDFTIDGGTLEMLSNTALGSTAIGNLANIAVNSTGAFYYNNATSGTVANPITLNGGTLSVAGNSQTYSGAVSINANSYINLRDANSATLTATGRSITLPGELSGSGKLTVDSVNTVSSGNQYSGTLILSAANPNWTGGMLLQRGTVDLRQEDSIGTGAVTVQAGRILFKGTAGTT